MKHMTPSKNQLALVKNAGVVVKTAVPTRTSEPDFAQKAMRIPNPEQAAAIVAEQASHEYDAAHAEYHETSQRQPELDKRFAKAEKHLDQLEEAVRTIPAKIKSNARHVDSDKENIAFGDWRPMDQLSAVMLFVAGCACLLMSSANVYSNLILSGEPFYLENRHIPIFISLLAPSCSVAIKFIGTMFESNLNRKEQFTKVVFMGSAATFIAWIALFAMINSGPSMDIDWGELTAETTDLSAWLALTQLMAEVLVGGALFLALQDVTLKYSPDYYCDNPAFISAVKARDAFKQGYERLREERNQNHSRKALLEAERQAYINQKLVDFLDLRSRLNQLNDLS